MPILCSLDEFVCCNFMLCFRSVERREDLPEESEGGKGCKYSEDLCCRHVRSSVLYANTLFRMCTSFAMLSSFTMDYDPDIPSEEPTIAIGMHFKAINQALQDRQLTGELAKMVMLPTDWEVRKARPMTEIQLGVYISLIGVSTQTFFIWPFSFLAE